MLSGLISVKTSLREQQKSEKIWEEANHHVSLKQLVSIQCVGIFAAGEVVNVRSIKNCDLRCNYFSDTCQRGILGSVQLGSNERG